MSRSVFCVWLFLCNDAMSLTVRKSWYLRLNVIYRLQSIVQRIWRRRQNHNLNRLLILDKYNIMVVMQKLKFMLQLTMQST